MISIRRGKSLDIDSNELILPLDKTFYMKSGIEETKPICIEEPFEGIFLIKICTVKSQKYRLISEVKINK